MSNPLKPTLKEIVRQSFLATGSIRAAAKEAGCGRNTARRLLRSEGLSDAKAPTAASSPVATTPEPHTPIKDLDFAFLEKMFELGRGHGENIKFEQQIKSLAKDLASDLGVASRIDEVRLEEAIFQYIVHRRFYFMSLEASDKCYTGSFSRSHEKLASAVLKWVAASNLAFDNFNKLVRELEVKNGKRSPLTLGGGVHVHNPWVKIEVPTAAATATT